MRDPGHSDAEAAFRIEEEHPHDGTAVLSLYGEADLHVAGELRDRLSAVLDGGPSSLVLDLSGVTFVDSMTLGILVGGAKRVRSAGGQMRLVVPHEPIRRIFEVTLLDRVFPLDETREQSLAATRAT